MNDKVKKALRSLYDDIDYRRDGFYKENVEALMKNAAKNKLKKAIYSAAFLDEGSREDLYNWWKMHTKQDLLPNVPKHSHMTIKFKPSEEEVLALPIGESSEQKVTVIGLAYDEFGQAVQVKVNDDSFARQDDGIAHITISTAKDVPPVYSNELLARGVEEVKVGPELSVKVGLFLNNQKISYDLDGTIYADEEITVDL